MGILASMNKKHAVHIQK